MCGILWGILNLKVPTCSQTITRRATIYTKNQSKRSQKTELDEDEDEDAVKLGKTCDQVQITQQVERHGMLGTCFRAKQ